MQYVIRKRLRSCRVRDSSIARATEPREAPHQGLTLMRLKLVRTSDSSCQEKPGGPHAGEAAGEAAPSTFTSRSLLEGGSEGCVDPRATERSKAQHSLRPSPPLRHHLQTPSAQRRGREKCRTGICLAQAAGFHNQTGVNSLSTLTHISTCTEAKTPSLTVNSPFPQPTLSWNEGHRGSNWYPACQGCSLRTRDTLCPFSSARQSQEWHSPTLAS